MKFKNWLLSIFNKNETFPTEHVFFDGDQTNKQTFDVLWVKDSKQTKFTWVSVHMHLPKFINTELINYIKPASVGKEATDTQIAMSIVDELHKLPSLKTIYIVTSDGDFLDTVINLSVMFPTKKFVIINNGTHCTSGAGTAAGRTLNQNHPNCSIIKIKLPEKKKSMVKYKQQSKG